MVQVHLEALYTKPRKQTLAGLYSFIGIAVWLHTKVTYYTSPGAATPQAITTSKGAIIFLQKLDYSDLLQYLCISYNTTSYEYAKGMDVDTIASMVGMAKDEVERLCKQ